MRRDRVEAVGPVADKWLAFGIAGSLWLEGCHAVVGVLPRVAASDPTFGYKLLKPGVTATECRSVVFGEKAAPDIDLAGQALGRMLSVDEEASVVVNARVESTWWTIGVYGRQCVTITGDVVRSTATILLPMAGEHAGHREH